MTRAEYQALLPEFGASSYNARIDALLPVVPNISATKAGARLNYILGLWVSWRLQIGDVQMQFGSAAAMSSSSTSTEKAVGKVSIKTSLSQSAGSSSSGSARPGLTNYGALYEEEIAMLGVGVISSAPPVAVI